MPQLPAGLIQSLRNAKGFNEDAFVQVHQSGEQVTSIRLNPQKQPVTANLPQGTPVPWCIEGFYLDERPSFTFDPAFHAGAYYVQEASSMFIHHILNQLYPAQQYPSTVLDLCAAPGGKSTLIASRFADSFIVSNEVINTRVTVLAENIGKWGSSNVVVTNNDPRDFKKLPGFFELMVVDAPCSGSGLFRKDPDAIGEWSEANVEMCSYRQQRILADAVPSLKTNGYLIYSTCSYSIQEDEAICDWIVENLQLQPVQIAIDTAWGVVETFSGKHNVPGYRFYPNKVKGEGFFVSCFMKDGFVEKYESLKAPPSTLNKVEKQLIEPWLKAPGELNITRQKETFIALPAKFRNEISAVRRHLNVRKSGVAVGSIKGDLVPHHELALSKLLHPGIPFVEVDRENSIRYLKRQELSIETSLKGWALVRYNGLNLGWIKILSNRINNYYPPEWRILKDR